MPYPLLNAIIILPLAGAILIALGNRHLPKIGAALLACATVGSGFLITVSAILRLTTLGEGAALTSTISGWSAIPGVEQLSLGLLGDGLSLWWLFVVTGVGLLIHIYSMGYMADDPCYRRFFAELNYFVFAMSLLVLSDNFVGLLIGWANVGLASFLLIGFWNQKPAAAAAAAKAFITNAVGELGIIMAAFLIWQNFGTFKYDAVFAALGHAPAGAITAIGLLLLIAAVAKSAQLPLHIWLPDAMQGPTPVSALIHAATMVTAGVYLVVRAHPIYDASAVAAQAVAVIGALSALFGAIVATQQTDIKRVLAFSTMSQIGYMMLGAGVGAYSAASFHFLTHAFFKALLFLGAGVVIHELGGEQDIRRMGGLGKTKPFAYWTFLAGVLAIAGAPPFAGFFSKDAILHHVLVSGHTGLWIIGVTVAGLTAYYMFRLFAMVFAGTPATVEAATAAHGGAARHAHGGDLAHSHAAVHSHSSGQSMLAPVGILALLSVVGGWLGIPGVSDVPGHFIAVQAAALHGEAATLFGWPLLVILGVAVLGAVTALVRFGPKGSGRRSKQNQVVASGFYFDAFYNSVVVRPLLSLAALVGSYLDPMGIDGAVNGVGRLVQYASSGVRASQSGYVRRYALSVIVGAVLFAAYYTLYV